ncbi:Ig-like domain-containing protein [Hyalangium versicolor]|uniref:Ig-like domain-containing protein n=1 Tax=Hyalangium versicolor TaxID=2861190 RepID=UPI001CCEDCAD|nr:Ig-like domain-containing protein [Hyalangium versicolor]
MLFAVVLALPLGSASAQDRREASTPYWPVPLGSWQRTLAGDGYTVWRQEIYSGCSFADHSYTLEVPADPQSMSDISYSMSNYDVDYNDTQGCSGGPEVDLMSFNGHQLGQVTGANDSWSINTWPLDKSQLVQGSNAIFIDTDATNTGCWCVGVGWIEVRAKVGFKVLASTPQDQDKNRDFHAGAVDLTVTFTAEYDPATLTPSTFQLEYRDPSGTWQPVGGSFSQLSPDKFRFVPGADLKDGVRYRATVKGGSSGVTSKTGAILDSDSVWYFWTVPDLSLTDAFNYGSGSVCLPPSTSCPGLEIAVFQTARNQPMVAGKPAVARLYLRWKQHTDVHADDQVRDLEVEARLKVGSLTQTQTQTLKRPDRYTAAEREAAQHTINLYQTPSASFTYEAEVTPRPQTNATPVKYTQTLALASSGKTPRLSFNYYFLKDGLWNGGVPAAARTEGTNTMTAGAQLITDNFPVLSTTFTNKGDYSIGYTFTGNTAGTCASTTTQVSEVSCPIGSSLMLMAEFRCAYARLDSLRGGASMIAATVPNTFCPGATAFAMGKVFMHQAGTNANDGTIAHETGHVFGISTANNPTAKHRNDSKGVEGFQVRLRKNRSNLESPNASISLMHTTLQPTGTQWVHNDDYATLLGTVSLAASSLLPSASAATKAPNYLIVSGFVDLDRGTAALQPAYLQQVPNDPPSPSGTCVVELLDGGGAVLASDHVTPITEPEPQYLEDPPPEAAHGPTVAAGPAYFSVSLPWSEAARSLRVSCNGNTLTTQQRSPHPPTVDFAGLSDGDTLSGVRSISWAGQDEDAPPLLSYQLQVLGENGNWTPLTPITPDTHFDLDTSLLPTGPQQLRVLVTDGFDSAFATRSVSIVHVVTVASTLPASGATQVPLTTTVQVQFGSDMLGDSISGSTFSLMGFAGWVPATVTYDAASRQATLTPSAPLQPAQEYTARLDASVQDLHGNTLGTEYTWHFTTSPDSTPPRVLKTSPPHGALGVPLNALVQADFDEDLNPTTLTTSSFQLLDPSGTPVAGEVIYDYSVRHALFIASAPLQPGVRYTARLDTAVTDAAGNALASPVSWSFTPGTLLSNGLRIVGNYGDQAHDLDGDGLYDNLTVSVDVEVLDAGLYNLNARLIDRYGSLLQWQTTGDVFLTLGVHRLSLVYGGAPIRSNGVDGPYILDSVNFYSPWDPSLADQQFRAYQTFPYSAGSFFSVLVFGGLPDQILETNTSRDDAFNLRDYTTHLSLPVTAIAYRLIVSTDPRVGVSIDGDANVDIFPQPGVEAESDVTIEARDPYGNRITSTFHVSVQLPRPAVLIAPAELTMSTRQSRQIDVAIQDQFGHPFTAPTEVVFSTTVGTVAPTHVSTSSGSASTVLTTGATAGTGFVTIRTGYASALVKVNVQASTSCTVPPGTPTLVLNGSSSMTLECGVDTWTDPGAKAWDACGPVDVHTYNSGNDSSGPGPNTHAEGTYSVQYVAWNSVGHTVSAIRSVTVDDRTPPTLKLLGTAQQTHRCGTAWVDPGVESIDACYGNVAPTVQRIGWVNGWMKGVYTVRYAVTDSGGNAAPPVTRTVEVVDCPW